ncbi:AAA family ATPase [Desulfococcaceae bacterium HSG7]|nr:AAA family ATPase [Desulfococcaceae bacterium HSG7]
MSEESIIRNFGPIEEANIELRDLTVFVGPQAIGKSLAAQSLYFLRRYETLLKDEKSSSEAALSTLEWQFGSQHNNQLTGLKNPRRPFKG